MLQNIPWIRYSFDVHCRAVALMTAGVWPSAAAPVVGTCRSRRYRWWDAPRMKGCGVARVPGHAAAAAESTMLRARQSSGAGPVTLGALLVPRGLDRGQGAAIAGVLPPAPRPPVLRYERARPGDLLHVDIEKLGRFWQVETFE